MPEQKKMSREQESVPCKRTHLKIQKISLIIHLHLKPIRATDWIKSYIGLLVFKGNRLIAVNLGDRSADNISVVKLGNHCIFLSKTCKGPCNIYCITGLVQNHFWNQKSQDPCRHNSAKIIGPCQYVYEKSVGPVGALTVGHSLIQMESGGCC